MNDKEIKRIEKANERVLYIQEKIKQYQNELYEIQNSNVIPENYSLREMAVSNPENCSRILAMIDNIKGCI
jgi:homospermidine synthase